MSEHSPSTATNRILHRMRVIGPAGTTVARTWVTMSGNLFAFHVCDEVPPCWHVFEFYSADRAVDAVVRFVAAMLRHGCDVEQNVAAPEV